METKEEAVKWLMEHECSVQKSLCDCINNKYNGNISEFLKNEFNVIDNGVLHLKWGENKGEKVSYSVEN